MRRFALLVAGLALLAGIAAAVSGGAMQAQPHWVAIDLDPQGTDSWALAINDDGWIVGERSTTRDGMYAWAHAVLWRRGRSIDLGTCNRRESSSAHAINDRGQIIGTCGSWGGEEKNSRAFVWQGGELTELGALPGREQATRATAINDRGQIVGWSTRSMSHAFLWEDGEMSDLGTLPGGRKSQAQAINNQGQIVGWSGNGAVPHAVIWQDGMITNLGTLPGTTTSFAIAINGHGQIIGQSYNPGGETHAVLWKQGECTDLGSLPGGRDSVAVAINGRGQVVGTTHTKSGHTHAFLWENGKMRDLGTLGGEWSQANAINDLGQTVGQTKSSGRLWEDAPAFVSQGAKIRGLPTLPRGEIGEAFAISNSGWIVGYSDSVMRPSWGQDNQVVQHAVLWTLKRG